MNKLSSVALSAALVVAGVGASVSAEAHPYFGVGIDLPRVVVVIPIFMRRPTMLLIIMDRAVTDTGATIGTGANDFIAGGAMTAAVAGSGVSDDPIT